MPHWVIPGLGSHTLLDSMKVADKPQSSHSEHTVHKLEWAFHTNGFILVIK